ncbi:TPA: hypothetical protein ACH3X1_013414 [Trebouxia sp. C0004]
MDIAAPSPLTNSGAPTPLHEAPTTSLTATSKPSVIAMEVDVGPGLDDDDDVVASDPQDDALCCHNKCYINAIQRTIAHLSETHKAYTCHATNTERLCYAAQLLKLH